MPHVSGFSRYVLIIAACQSSTIGRGPIRMTRGDVLRYNLAYALIRASKIVRGVRQALIERERYAVADHVVAHSKSTATLGICRKKRAHRRGRRRDNDPNHSCLERRGLRLLDKQLTPATRADVALDEFARIRRLEVEAAVAALVALGRVLIVGGCLADLCLRHGLRHGRSGCRHTERSCRVGDHYST